MAFGLALDKYNDLIIESNEFVRTSDGAYVAQKVRSNLQMIQGENENNPKEGVPYFSTIFIKPVDLAGVASILKSTILNTEGVNSLARFDFNLDKETREFILDFSVNTTWGEIVVSDFILNKVPEVGDTPSSVIKDTIVTDNNQRYLTDTNERLTVETLIGG